MAEGLAQIIVIVAISLIIGIYIFATIGPTLDNTTVTNESVGYLNGTAAGPNTLCVDFAPIAPGSTTTVYNSSTATSNQNTLTAGTDYSIVPATGCITNVTDVEWIRVTYTYGQLSSAADSSFNTATTTTFSGFQLAAVVVIVIAAAAILRQLGMI